METLPRAFHLSEPDSTSYLRAYAVGLCTFNWSNAITAFSLHSGSRLSLREGNDATKVQVEDH